MRTYDISGSCKLCFSNQLRYGYVKTSAIFINVSSDGNDLPVTILLTATFEMPTFSASKADVTFLADIISFNCKFIKFA